MTTQNKGNALSFLFWRWRKIDKVADLKESENLLKQNKWKRLVKNYFIKIPLQLSQTYAKMQKSKEAIDYASIAISQDLTDTEGLKWKAVLKENIGDFAGAIEDLNEAMKNKPNDHSLTRMRNRLTYVFLEDKKYSNR